MGGRDQGKEAREKYSDPGVSVERCGKVWKGAYSWKEVSTLSLCVPHIYLFGSSEVLHDVKLLLGFPLFFASSSSVKARSGI